MPTRSVRFVTLVLGAALAGCAGTNEGPVAPEVSLLSVTPATLAVTIGQTAQLSATAYSANGTALGDVTVTWSSTAPAIATVNGTGLVTGVAQGSAVVVASAAGKEARTTVVVTSGGGGAATITVNPAAQDQVMAGWEATAQAGQGTAAFPFYRDTLLALAVDLGIDRLRVAVRSGIEDTVDYYPLRKTMGESAYNCIAYQTVNDDADPSHINWAGFHFTELDSTIEQVVLPMEQKMAAAGRHLSLNFNYTSWPCAGHPDIHTNPAEYAEFALAVLTHVQQKYGLVPDFWEMILEPDNGSAWNSGTLIGQALAATAQRLAAAGFHPGFIAPSTESAANALPFFSQMQQVPGTAGLVTELSYHRYGGVTTASLGAIGQATLQYGIQSAMLEHIGSGYQDLQQDLTLARVSAWQQYTLAFATSDDGSHYFDLDVTNPSHPVVTLAQRTRYLRQYFHYIRPGAVRVDAASTQGGVAPVAFINGDGKAVVVVTATGPASFGVAGLPAGTYGITYTTATATAAAGADQTTANGQAVQATIPAAGVLTIFGR